MVVSDTPAKRRRILGAGIATVCVAAILVLAGLGVQPLAGWLASAFRGGSGPPVDTGVPIEGYENISYVSSVDGTALSYHEWLPVGYVPSDRYPFLLYLHGKGFQGDQLISDAGGISLLNAALTHGFIVGALYTRSVGGFYVNSNYTGPQEQDVLDAIAHERAIRNVSSLYLVGESMGTLGAYHITADHPGLVAGIGLIASCSDLYEQEQYELSINNSSDLDMWRQVTGGDLANGSAYAAGLTFQMSAGRFEAANFSGVRVYLVHGGNDNDCENNPAFWPYEQANDTVDAVSCASVSALDEPAGCTTPLATLATEHPGQFLYRYVYEPTATHTLNDVDGSDLIGFFLGEEPTGTYDTGGGDGS